MTFKWCPTHSSLHRILTLTAVEVIKMILTTKNTNQKAIRIMRVSSLRKTKWKYASLPKMEKALRDRRNLPRLTIATFSLAKLKCSGSRSKSKIRNFSNLRGKIPSFDKTWSTSQSRNREKRMGGSIYRCQMEKLKTLKSTATAPPNPSVLLISRRIAFKYTNWNVRFSRTPKNRRRGKAKSSRTLKFRLKLKWKSVQAWIPIQWNNHIHAAWKLVLVSSRLFSLPRACTFRIWSVNCRHLNLLRTDRLKVWRRRV